MAVENMVIILLCFVFYIKEMKCQQVSVEPENLVGKLCQK